MKKLFYIFVLIFSLPSYAQNIIYKCIDKDGNVSYMNDTKLDNCEKTNLSKVDKSTTLNKVVTIPSTVSQTNTSNSSSNEKIQNEEQKNRDNKRISILQNELALEKKQLDTVKEMISKTADKEQIKKLQDMIVIHNRNIASLSKEIGKDLVQNTLPVSIPKPMSIEPPKGLIINKTTIKPKELPKEPALERVIQEPALITNKSLKKS